MTTQSRSLKMLVGLVAVLGLMVISAMAAFGQTNGSGNGSGTGSGNGSGNGSGTPTTQCTSNGSGSGSSSGSGGSTCTTDTTPPVTALPGGSGTGGTSTSTGGSGGLAMTGMNTLVPLSLAAGLAVLALVARHLARVRANS